MDEIIQERSGETLFPPLIKNRWKRIVFGFFVIFAPIYNFSIVRAFKPEWQSGELGAYILLMLQSEAAYWMIYLMVYSVIVYLLLLWNEEFFANVFLVRLGVYGGTLLALYYSVLIILTWEIDFSTLWFIAVWLAIPALFVAEKFIQRHWKIITTTIYLAFALLFVLYFFNFEIAQSFFVFLSISWLVPAVGMPFWCFLIALHASHWLLKHYETKFSFTKGLGVVAWLSAYAFALRFNILKMFELYNALPTEPPNCYIATAAAKGHPRFVGSREVTLANGKSMRVNRQLQRLKALEIAMMGVSAPSHRMMRRVYDVLGKWLAKQIQNPLLADVAYLILVPVELLSFFVLKSIVPEIQTLSERLYRS